jgi:PKD repeat protein
VADVSVDDDDGEFPHRVAFDATGSALGAGPVTYEWSFGDGTVTREGPTTFHTYIGAGEFVARLTLSDASGRRSVDEVTIDVSAPDCPDDEPPLTLGDLEDDDLDGISGLVASRIEPSAYWMHQDIDVERIVAVDLYGETLSEHELEVPLLDVEDIAAAVDPSTGLPMLFIGDFGDNDRSRAEVAIWIVEEPDPLDDGDIDPFQVRLAYPHGPVNTETLLVDPLNLDLFLITKRDDDSESEVFVKRAPHEEGGPFLVEALGEFESLDFTVSGGDVSLDGLRVVVRGYGDTARVWYRDGLRPLEEVFAQEPCRVDISDEEQGEAVAFSIDGRGLVTTSEGEGEPVWFIGI